MPMVLRKRINIGLVLPFLVIALVFGGMIAKISSQPQNPACSANQAAVGKPHSSAVFRGRRHPFGA